MMNKITAAIAALLISAGWADAQVNLTGTGTVTVKPDMAYVTLSVVTENANAAEATKANTASITTLCAAVEAAGIKKDDIKTAGFSVSPKYVYPKDGDAKITGYTVHNSLSVTVHDMKILGSLLDKAVVNGASRIAGVRYDVKEKKALYDQARKNALADAKVKAELYATAGEFKLGGIKSITEDRVYDDDGTRSEGMYTTRGAAAARLDVPVAPGELKFHVYVTASWAIE